LIPDVLKMNPPLLPDGSGKLGTPLARMHLANASAFGVPVAGAVVRELVVPPPVAVLDPAVVAWLALEAFV
jgi:hypothetical protein